MMLRTVFLGTGLALLMASSALAQVERREVGQLVYEGAPAVSPELQATISPYYEVRAAVFEELREVKRLEAQRREKDSQRYEADAQWREAETQRREAKDLYIDALSRQLAKCDWRLASAEREIGMLSAEPGNAQLTQLMMELTALR